MSAEMLGPFELGRVHCGDCLELMKQLPDGCIDAVVTDPPYGLEFMGKEWDAPHKAYIRKTSERDLERANEQDGLTARRRNKPEAYIAGSAFQAWATDWATELLRVCKPGAHLLAFGGTRTFHRLACALEDAGWEIRDCIMWVYGSGFPKSLDVSKAIDKAAGLIRPRVPGGCGTKGTISTAGLKPGEAISGEAKQWQGWGTALKPAWEPIIVARKSLVGTVAANVLKHGTGALNIDGCRIEGEHPGLHRSYSPGVGAAWNRPWQDGRPPEYRDTPPGRFPANVIHDGSEEVLACFPDAPGQLVDASDNAELRKTQNVYGVLRRGRSGEPSAESENGGAVGFKMRPGARRLDAGSAARFFYCAKAGPEERAGDHPTVKPLALMRYLCKLVTPPEGVILDPFSGSGTTGVAAMQQGFWFLGLEKDPHYCGDICAPRLEAAAKGLTPAEHKMGQGQLFDGR